jgi:hypothetical protein
MPAFHLQRMDDNGIWHTLRDSAGAAIEFPEEAQARQYLREQFPVAVQLEQFAGPKSVRVIVAQPYKDIDEAEEEAWRSPNKPAKDLDPAA